MNRANAAHFEGEGGRSALCKAMKKAKRPTLREKLHSLNQSGSLALMLGAGISVGCGLPDWQELMQRVVKKIWKGDPLLGDIIINEHKIITARHSKKRNGQQFNKIVADCLYEGDIIISKNLLSIAASRIKIICNFNYDDLLEEALYAEGIKPKVVLEGDYFDPLTDEVKVFHPHGFIERTATKGDLQNAKLVIAENDYNALYSNPHSWINVLLLSILTNYSVIFIGMSLSDPNIRRLLDVVRSNGFNNQHFAILRDPSQGVQKDKKKHFEKLKKMKEFDLKMFRITPWWISDYSDIGDIFDRIRKRG